MSKGGGGSGRQGTAFGGSTPGASIFNALLDPGNITGVGNGLFGTTRKDAQGNEVAGPNAGTGFRPPSGYNLVPPQNSWTGMNFNMPGLASPAMSSNILEMFPQLKALFGGMTTGGGPGGGQFTPPAVGGGAPAAPAAPRLSVEQRRALLGARMRQRVSGDPALMEQFGRAFGPGMGGGRMEGLIPGLFGRS